MEIAGGTTYSSLGASKLNQEPYGIYVNSASNIVGGTQTISDSDNDTKIQVEEPPDKDAFV